MKRHGLFLITVCMLSLFAFICGCGKSDAPRLETHPTEAKPVGEAKSGVAEGVSAVTLTGETDRVGNVTDGQSGPLSVGAKPVDVPESVGTNSHGYMMSPDGSVYEGEVTGNVPNGRGTVTDMRGTHQRGEWRNGRAYRLSGTWVGPDGTKEEGTWNLDGNKSGGTITYPDGRVYKGDWRIVAGKSELPHGSGTMTWPDGRKYVGQFQNGRMDGRGVMNYPGGKVEDGLWKQGEFLEAVK